MNVLKSPKVLDKASVCAFLDFPIKQSAQVEPKQQNFNQGDYYVNLPISLYSDLKFFCNKDDSISIGLLALLTNLILTQRYADKDYREGREWVRLNASILRSKYDTTNFKSKRHLEFLLENGIIEMMPHHHNPNGKKGYSRSYRIHQKYFEITKKGSTIFDSALEIIPIHEYCLKRKSLKHIEKRKNVANSLAKHLTRWLSSEKIKFEKEAAMKFVNSKYPKNKSKKIQGRNEKRMYHIKYFEALLKIYSMEGKNGRLHSCFTALPSDLKQFVKFDNKSLKEADIKSSQPFILTVVLEIIITKYLKEINRKGYITKQHFTKKTY